MKLRAFIALAATFLSTTMAIAQPGVGSLQGRIAETDSGRSLEGAIVAIPDTNFRDYTDAAGRYLITGIPPGQYVVTVSYVGLQPASSEVAIAADRSTPHDASLAVLSGIDTITVQTARTGSSRAINQQKTAAGIVNIISEEQFGAMVDSNIGQALQRMPGVSVDEDQDGSQGNINIRGVSGEFNSVQLDGNRVPSSGGSNAFNPRQLAADGVSTVELIKAPTPDRDGDAIGGIVNIVSRSAFERSEREMSLDVGQTLNDESDNWGHALSFNYSDLIGFNGEDDNLGIRFTVSSYETDRFSINADQDWVQVDPATNPGLNLDGYGVPVWFMESTHFEHDTRKTDTNTISGSIDIRLGDNSSIYFRPLLSFYERSGVKYETDIDIDTAFENELGGDKTYAVLTPNYGRGTDASEASRGWIGTLEDTENELYSLSMGGRTDLEAGLLTYDLSWSGNESTINNDSELNMLMEPDDPWFIFEYQIYDPKGEVRVDVVNGVDPTDLSQMTEGELSQVFGSKDEEALSARLDWERDFVNDNSVFSLKMGAKHRVSSQFRDETVNVYEMDETFPYANVLVPTNEIILLKPKYFDVQPAVGLAMLGTDPGLFAFVEDDSLEDSNIADYDAEETITAGYVMGTYEKGIHTMIVGARFEQFEWDNTNKIVSYLNDVATVTPVDTGDSHSFWLPGLHLRHALSDNLILRESFNRSYGRPRLSELSRGRWIDDDGNIEDGNPDLEPAMSDNFDIQIEYYTDHGGLYSIGYFYKDITDFTYTQTYDFDVLGPDGIPVPADGGALEYERPVNGAGAVNSGVELIARHSFYSRPGALRGFSVGASATFTDSDAEYPNRTDGRELPLEGFSDLLYTFTLGYNWNRLSARIDYRFRDDYIEGLGADIESDEFFGEEKRIDAEIEYHFTDQWQLSAAVTNLKARPLVSYQGYPQFVEDASYPGRKYNFAIRYDF